MTVLFILALLAACVDWWAVSTNHAKLEAIAKPLVLVFAVGGVLLSGPGLTAWLVIAGLTLSVVGDLLLLPQADRFVAGLGAFLAAHVFYVAAFLRHVGLDSGTELFRLGVAVGVAIATWLSIGRRVVSASRRDDPAIAPAVVVYIAALCAMLVCGLAIGSVTVAIGAVLFATSDAILGWNRFVSPLPRGRLATHIPYHLGQVLLALWAAGLG
jgi:uncharacterized membrane protein YhhN